MKQKTIATRHLRTKIAAGYVLILFVIFGIIYIWLNEQNRQQELEATTPCRRICSNKTNVPADLQSAGIEYKDFLIRLLPCRRICTNKTNVPADLQSAGI